MGQISIKIFKEVTSNTDKSTNVGKEVDEKSNENGKIIHAHQQKNADEVGNSVTFKAVDTVNNGIEAGKQLGANFYGIKDVENPEAQRFANNNRAVNSDIYTHAQQGDNKLITPRYSGDEINKHELKNTSNEDLARIYNYDKNNDKLSDNSKVTLHNELEKRGYDFNSNQYSSKYSPTEIKSSVIKDGDKYNPGSDIQSTDKINKGKSDFAFDWKNTFDKSSEK